MRSRARYFGTSDACLFSVTESVALTVICGTFPLSNSNFPITVTNVPIFGSKNFFGRLIFSPRPSAFMRMKLWVVRSSGGLATNPFTFTRKVCSGGLVSISSVRRMMGTVFFTVAVFGAAFFVVIFAFVAVGALVVFGFSPF